MNQKELAALLDISPAMVSRLAKRGMPTDDLERAQRWRKRHLEPSRVKGSRVDTVKPKTLAPTSPNKPRPAAPAATLADMEALGDLINGALIRGNQDAAAFRVAQLRQMIRCSEAPGSDERICLSVRVWLALLDYMLHPESAIRHAPDLGAYLTAGECGERIAPKGGAWPAHVVLWECCDFDDNAVNGWPDGEGKADD